MKSLLEIKGLSKSFGENHALSNVDFNLNKGEIHGIVGANGSGKSTFLNILFGSDYIYETGGYKGDIYIDGKKINIRNSYDAWKSGIGMVHQEFALLSELSVSSNIKINRENTYFITDKIFTKDYSLVDRNRNNKESSNVLSKLGINIDIDLIVNNLSVNIKQFIEVAREIDKENLKILLLDEPTASLNKEDVKLLLNALKDIANSGTSIIFISHRLEEVVELCDRLTILRDGEVTSTYVKREFNIDKIAVDMVGEHVVKVLRENYNRKDNIAMSFNNLKVNYGKWNVEDISLNIYDGEILGITSLAGHGQDIFGYGLTGMNDMKGEVIINGQKIVPGNIPDVFDKGIYVLPDERKEMGLLMDYSVSENITYGTWDSKKLLGIPWLKGFSFLKKSRIKEYSLNMIEKLNIKVDNINQPVRELSGGNQQKVCLAHAMGFDPRILFISEPTRGIDIYSKEVIIDMLLRMNEEKNLTIVISSGEIGELKRICDRIVVMFEGKVFGIYDPNEADEVFSLAISGRRHKKYEKA